MYKPQEKYEIIEKRDLSDVISEHIIYAPLIARSAKPGHFVILMKDNNSERIPVTLVDWNKDKGTITVIIQSIGKSTADINSMKKGDFFLNVSGPLGTPVEVKKVGTVVGIGGGVGIAELYPIAKAFKEAGNKVISILGARNKDLLILEKETKEISDEILITTDDGSYGKKGVVTDALKELYERGEKIDSVFTIGPLIMMKFVALATKPHSTPTYASLNPIMLDATGMCGGCKVEVDGKFKFACVDGPMFDAHKVNFESLLKRNNAFKEFEEQSLKEFEKKHNCKIGLH
ncbi:MAG TPA: sulfide/dihydroorotate dehydrogenase-like FAD/NAD-binding protein [Elusimicrobiales bacterium]|nr:sulfide/dihydroorotate dehydrogenase-like FAD/NAD-binding protein [Elusimicrobiales bacterium]